MTSVDRYARRLSKVESDVKNLATQPRLPNSSIDGGALEVRDIMTGETTAIIGTQFDGTTSAASVGGTFPVAPTMPLVTEIVGGLRIYWDGTYVDGSPTRMDFRRVTFHAVTDVDLIDPLDPAQIVGEVTIATGGEVTVGLPYVEHFIYAIVWTEAGKFSVESDVAFGTPLKVQPADTVGDGQAPEPPSGWAATLTPLGVMALQAQWPEVPNADAVTYDVYLSTTSGFTTTDETTFVGSTGGTFIAIRSMPDGTPLARETVYYARVVARDRDGESALSDEGSSSVRLADGDAISPAWVYTGGVDAGQILTGELQASLVLVGELKTSGTGRRVTLSSADGLKAEDPGGAVIAHIPTDPTQDIQLKADVVAKSVTALGTVAMRAAANEIAQSAALILRTGTTAPVSPPTASITWTSITPGINPGASPFYRGGNYDAGSNRMYNAWTFYGSGGVHWFNATTGAFIDGVSTSHDGVARTCYGAFRYGANIYAHVRSHDAVDSGGYIMWFVHIYNATTKAFVGAWQLGNDATFSGLHEPAITVDSSGNLVLVYTDSASGTVTVSRYNRDTGAVLSREDTGIVYGGKIMSAYCGNADVGSERVWFTADDLGSMWCWNPSSGRDGNREFPAAFDQPVGLLAYDTTRGCFVGGSRTTQAWFLYDGTNWTTESSTWYATGTWKDTDATGGTHETVQGPPVVFTMKRRARLALSSPPIPSDPDNANHDDPNAVRFYLGRVDGTRATQFLNASPADGVTTATVQTAIFSNADTNHPNPPATGNFPNLTPGAIRSDSADGNGPIININGDGSARLGDLSVSAAGRLSWVTPHFKGRLDAMNYSITTGNFIVYQSVVENTGGGTWTPGTGRYTVPVAGIYRVTFQWKTDGSGGTPQHQIRKGASTVLYYQYNPPGGAFSGGNCTWEGRLNAGDDIGILLVAGPYTTQSDGLGVDNNFMTIDYVRS
jgi:hypothetical protein